MKTNRRSRAPLKALLFSSRLEPSARQATGVPGVPRYLSKDLPKSQRSSSTRKSYSSHYTLRIESEPNGSSHPFLGGVPISPIQLVALKESGSPTHSKTPTRHAKVPTVRGLRQSRIIAPGRPVPSLRLFTRDNLKSSQDKFKPTQGSKVPQAV